MKILIVGAGAVSSVITHHLSTDKRVSEVLCGSNDLKRARSFIKVHNKKIKLISLDAANINDIVRRAVGVDLIINASLPRFNVNIMEAALKVGAHYQDLASELKDLKTVEQFKFNKRFERAGLTGLINTGVAPGVTNLLAREAADMFDVVDSIHIRCVEEQKASEFVFSWSAETTFDDLTAPPLVYKNGKFKTTKPFHDPEDYEGEPIQPVFGFNWPRSLWQSRIFRNWFLLEPKHGNSYITPWPEYLLISQIRQYGGNIYNLFYYRRHVLYAKI